jgi:hypothetical protein
MKRLFYLCLLLLAVVQVPAQNRVRVESIRSFSMIGPSMNYLEDTSVQSSINTKLSVLLNNNYRCILSNTSLPIQILTSSDDLKKNNFKFSSSDTSTWHLFIEIYEYNPFNLLAGSTIERQDSIILSAAASVFQISCILTNGLQEIVNNQTIFAAISNTETNGFGVRPKSIFLTKKSFASLIQVGLQMVLDPNNETAVMEIKAPTVYYGDNFIMNQIKNTSKIFVQTFKDSWSFNLMGTLEVLRMEEQLFDEIWINRKLVDSSASELLIKKMKETGNTASSDFIYLRQDCRDVYQDKNYTIKIATEIDPYRQANSKKEIFSNFLSGPVHLILQEKDTVAVFSIHKMIGDPIKKIYLDETTNGIDSSSIAKVSKKEFPFQVTYDYQLTGKLRGANFTINSFWNHEMKELYLNHRLIAMVNGKTDPENFVIMKDFTDASMMKELLLIAYNKFLL